MSKQVSRPRDCNADGFQRARRDVDNQAADFTTFTGVEIFRHRVNVPIMFVFVGRADGSECLFDEGGEIMLKVGIPFAKPCLHLKKSVSLNGLSFFYPSAD